jgi:predicted RNase H-like nuclease
MRLVLGIDAAWTEKNPSGVALAQEDSNGWRLIAVESSYERFRERAKGREPQAQPSGEKPDVPSLLDACRRLAEREPDLVAVDMPLSRCRITGPRQSDRCLSAAFAALWAGAYSPNELRPGPISPQMRDQFKKREYPLCTRGDVTTPGLIEVYPHPALLSLITEERRLSLFDDNKRLRYKIGKTKQYWEDIPSPRERREKLREVWSHIVIALDQEIGCVDAKLGPAPHADARLQLWKAYEDRLDAIICAWVAIRALDGEAEAFGNDVSAIWVPRPGARAATLP